MLFQTHGTKFFALTEELKCTRCNNFTVHEIRQQFFSQALVVIPLGTQNHKIFNVVCPICQGTRTFNLSRLARGSSEAKRELLSLLVAGKYHTKSIVDKLGTKDRNDLFKRMNAIEAYDLVQFLSGY